jgi:hypothetical protein
MQELARNGTGWRDQIRAAVPGVFRAAIHRLIVRKR